MRKVLGSLLLILGVITIGVKSIVIADMVFETDESFTLSANEILNIDGNAVINSSSAVDASAVLTNIILSGNWANAGAFIPGDGTVSFINNSLISNISGNTNFYNFNCTAPGKQFNFQAGSVQTILKDLVLDGQAPGTEIVLRSLTSGTRWTFDVTDKDQSVNYLNIQDSQSSSNSIYALNSINAGNNDNLESPPRWVFGFPIGIISPGDGSSVGQVPTIIGQTQNPNTAFTIQGVSGGGTIVVAQGISDDNGNFRVVVDSGTTLDLGANNLIPYVGAISGSVVNVNVIANPTAQQVCTINVPLENEKIKTNPFTVSGFGPLGAEIRVEALDGDGNLILNCGSAIADATTGAYTIAIDPVLNNMGAGINILSATAYNGSGIAIATSILKTVIFYNPFGVVFDAITDTPIEEAVITLYYDNDPGFGTNWIAAQPGAHIDSADLNPQITTQDGSYSFICVNGNFYVNINALGYSYPSTESSLPAGRTIVNGSRGEVFSVNGGVIEMDHPMSPTEELLRIEKEANKKEASIGDIITYTITIESISSGNVSKVYIEDKIPAGFKYLKGKVILDGFPIAEPTGGRPLLFDIGDIAAGQTRILRYQLVIGSGVSFGDYENIAFAKYDNRIKISNEARKTVKVVPDPVFDLGTIIGKVFWDINENGVQDNLKEINSQGIDKQEAGIANVVIVMEDGTIITTDKDGKYHIPAVMYGRHILKIDTSTLPDGSYLTTEEAVIVDITPGILSKVNFGIGLPKGKSFVNIPFQIVQDKNLPDPRLNVIMVSEGFKIKDVKLEGKAEFRIFTNYYFFIDKWRLEIIDNYSKDIVTTFKGTRENIFKPIYWSGENNAKDVIIKPDSNYAYRLIVTDIEGLEDRTKEIDFEFTEEETFGSIIQNASRTNNLEIRNIKMDGETLRIKNQKDDISLAERIKDIVIFKTEETKGELIFSRREEIRLNDLLEGRSTEESADKDEIEVILPRGEYDIRIKNANKNITNNIEEGVVMADLKQIEETYTKHIKIGDEYLFFVALGDIKQGITFNRGDIEPVGQDEKYLKGTWVEGRLAYYLKGKIKGKYLITSSFDSDRRKKELFKNLDPDKYYPIYGDASEIDYTATQTQGMLYVLVEFDKSKILWGNYETAFSDTEFARFVRTLYGGKVHIESVSTTEFGDPQLKMIVFGAYARQKAAHNEFTGTGGSLYYAKHKDILEGSEKIKIEVRDKITGLVLFGKNMTAGIDYEIDYSNGRITFIQPIPSFSASGLLISNNLLDGNPVYVVADYEYETRDTYDEGVGGIRVSKTIGDYFNLGGTYVKEEQQNTDYELKGVDANINVGNNVEFSVEYAESESEATGSFISTNGGISFTELPTDNYAKDKAYGIKGRAQLLSNKNWELSSYYKWIGKYFSTSATSSQQGKELIGLGTLYDITRNTKFIGAYDIQKLIEDGNAQTKMQVGATRTETTTLQIIQDMDRLQLTGEYRHQEVTERKDEFKSETNTKGDTLAIRGDYEVNERVDISLEQQATLTGDVNHQTTAGVDAQVLDWLSLRGKETVGTRGNATSIGATSSIGNRLEIANDYSRVNYNNGKIGDRAAVSTTARLDQKTSINTSYALADSMSEDKASSLSFGLRRRINSIIEMSADRKVASSKDKKDFANIFGLTGNINSKWAMMGTFEQGIVQELDGTQFKRKAGTLGFDYVDKDLETQEIMFKASSKFELRLDKGEEDKKQYLVYGSMEGKLNPNTTLFIKANLSQTKNDNTNLIEAQYKEFVFGSAYRPVNFDWLNLLTKYTYLEDASPALQIDINDDIEEEKAHVMAGEAVIDVSKKWQLTEKLACKIGEEKVTGFDFTKTLTWLWINRIGYNVYDNWKVAGEYRILTQREAQDQKQGWLVEVYRKLNQYIEVGVGYNFTQFNDELTHLNYTAQGPFIRFTAGFYDVSALRKNKNKN